MSQYVYIKSEPYLYTVGFYNDGKWNTDSDHDTKDEAAKRVSYLNGNHSAYNNELVKALEDARDTLLLCTLIDKSNTSDKSLKIVEAALQKVK